MENLNIVTVTPSKAAEWLTKNVGNRPIREQRVELYASLMRQGKWKLTGEAVIFSKSGRMINGQHRCLACIRSGVPFSTVVFTNAEEDVYDVLDTGATRSPGDALTGHGVKNAHATAACARLVLSYEAEALPDSAAMTQACTRQALVAEVLAYPEDYTLAVNYSLRSKAKTHLNGAALAAAMVLLRAADQPCEEWFEALASGAGLEVGDSRLALRSWAFNARNLGGLHHLASIIRAWNAHVAGESRSAIKGWLAGTPYPRFTYIK